MRTCAVRTDHAHGKTLLRSARSIVARKPAHATSQKLHHCALSFRKCPTSPAAKQDAVHIALTPFSMRRGTRCLRGYVGTIQPEHHSVVAAVQNHLRQVSHHEACRSSRGGWSCKERRVCPPAATAASGGLHELPRHGNALIPCPRGEMPATSSRNSAIFRGSLTVIPYGALALTLRAGR